MPASWTFAVARDDLSRTTLADGEVPALADGEALLRVDRVGLTANNVTYAVLGEAMRYWEFFPPGPRGLGPEWGLPPLWGFADVVSGVHGVPEGTRVYGYLPPADHLVVRPGRVDEAGFHDVSEHRAELPSPYNSYRATSGDPAYHPDQEDLLILLRPLFFTSFMLADQMIDRRFHDARTVVFSSASSKTAYAAAMELRGRGPRLVGLTSEPNVAFTRSLDCYDDVIAYGEIGALEVEPTVYLDLSGRPSIRAAVRSRLGEALLRDIAVGLTDQAPNIDAADEFFFAPVQMRKRRQDWGRDELDRRFAEAWQRFAAELNDRLEVQVTVGPEALREAWGDVLAGRVPPRIGRVVSL
jgi:hypothetical protein